ncbi:MAG: hypothetical protein JW912_08450, partial [Sedimentisphaerales bacterium]|nr:hypothetical protein [Sedimentisphaerales bacterium]
MDRRGFLKTSLVTGTAISMNASLGCAKSGENNLKDSNYMVLPTKKAHVLGQYDVIVAGAGLGGVS